MDGVPSYQSSLRKRISRTMRLLPDQGVWRGWMLFCGRYGTSGAVCLISATQSSPWRNVSYGKHNLAEPDRLYWKPEPERSE